MFKIILISLFFIGCSSFEKKQELPKSKELVAIDLVNEKLDLLIKKVNDLNFLIKVEKETPKMEEPIEKTEEIKENKLIIEEKEIPPLPETIDNF